MNELKQTAELPLICLALTALYSPGANYYLEGRQIRKVVVVPERLVNIVCG